MGFWDSYKRLPKYQRVLLGVSGIVVGWYGPTWMNYLFLEPGVLVNDKNTPPSQK